MNSKKGILFDLDGTLWDATVQIAASWKKVIDSFHFVNKTLTVAEIKSCMGLPMDQIFRRLFPNLQQHDRDALQAKCQQYENAYLASHPGCLYLQVRQTLEQLKGKGFHLFIVTNAQSGYIEAFFSATNLQDLFDDYEMFGRTGLLKSENIKLVRKRNALDGAAYVGDTQQDYLACVDANIPFIHAAYGFGNAEKAVYRLPSFAQLPDMIDKVI